MSYQKGGFLRLPTTPPVFGNIRQASKRLHHASWKLKDNVRSFEANGGVDQHDIIELRGQVVRCLNELVAIVVDSSLCESDMLPERVRGLTDTKLDYSTDFFSWAGDVDALHNVVLDILLSGWQEWLSQAGDLASRLAGDEEKQQYVEDFNPGILTERLRGVVNESFDRVMPITPALEAKESELTRKEQVLQFLEDNGPTSCKAAAEEFGITVRGMLSHLDKLKKEQKLSIKDIRTEGQRIRYYAHKDFKDWQDFRKSLGGRPSLTELLKIPTEDVTLQGEAETS